MDPIITVLDISDKGPIKSFCFRGCILSDRSLEIGFLYFFLTWLGGGDTLLQVHEILINSTEEATKLEQR
jgi:hypothetical protein